MKHIKIHFKIFALVFIAVVSASIFQPAEAAYGETFSADYSAYDDGMSDGYIMKIRDGLQMEATLQSFDGIQAENGITDIGNGFYAAETMEAVQTFIDHNSAEIEYIEPNYLISLFEYPSDISQLEYPSDITQIEYPGGVSLLEYPYDANDTYYNTKQWNLGMVSATEAWKAGLDGSCVKVAVIDSGLVEGHEDINYANVISPGIHYMPVGSDLDSEVDRDGVTTDNIGHGSFVTGIIAANTNNGLGIAGMAENVSVLPLKCFDINTDTSYAMIISAINDAMFQGCDVINMSFGATRYSPAFHDTVNAAASAGIIMTAAVGNMGTSELNYPAAFDNVIGVGSVGQAGTVSTFSNKNNSEFVVAPGEALSSIGYSTATTYNLSIGSGTSYATPAVTAMAAIAKQYDKDINTSSFKQLLIQSSVYKSMEYYDELYKYRIVNVGNLVAELKRVYTITYNLNGGSFNSEVSVTDQYAINSDTLFLPEPVREGYIFSGWYSTETLDQEPSSSVTTAIAGGSMGDRVYFAKWTSDNNTNITGLYVGGYKGTITAESNYIAYLPSGTALSADSSAVVVVTENPAATYTAQTADAGATWVVTVTSASSETITQYYINVDNTTYHAPGAVSGEEFQVGTATPASLDALTTAVPYIAEDISMWFTDDDKDAEGNMVDQLSFSVVDAVVWDSAAGAAVPGDAGIVKGEVSIDINNKLTFVPAAEDAGKLIVIEISAYDGRFESLSNVAVNIQVAELPVSTSTINMQSVNFDKFIYSSDYKDAMVIVNLFGNTLISVKNGGYVLTEEDLIVADIVLGISEIDGTHGTGTMDKADPELNSAAVSAVIKKEYLSKLGEGETILSFEFSAGNPKVAGLAINITDTTLLGLSVNGTVNLAGREAGRYDGAIVKLTPKLAGPEFTITTNSAGEYSFTGVTPGDYTLTIEKSGYLSFQKTTLVVNANIVQNAITLKGGDVNGDGQVTSTDLSLLLGSYMGVTTAAIDINGDGQVTSSDLSLLLGNYLASKDIVE